MLRELLGVAIAAADPLRLVGAALPERPAGRTLVVGAGKAAAAMAQAVEAAWTHGLQGLVVTRYGHALATRDIAVIEAAHPVPDEAGTQAAERIAALLQRADER